MSIDLTPMILVGYYIPTDEVETLDNWGKLDNDLLEDYCNGSAPYGLTVSMTDYGIALGLVLAESDGESTEKVNMKKLNKALTPEVLSKIRKVAGKALNGGELMEEEPQMFLYVEIL